jgi:hypothetical protein
MPGHSSNAFFSILDSGTLNTKPISTRNKTKEASHPFFLSIRQRIKLDSEGKGDRLSDCTTVEFGNELNDVLREGG